MLTLRSMSGLAFGLADAADTVALVVPKAVATFARLAFGNVVAWVTQDPERPELSRVGLKLTPGAVTWLKVPGGVALGIAV